MRSGHRPWRVVTRRYESDTPETSRCIDSVTPTMNHNMMVKPTKSDQIVGIGRSALRPWLFVMWLQPIATGATFGGTCSITMEDKPPQPRGNHTFPASDREWLSVSRLHQLKTPAASNLFQNLGSD